MSAEPLRLDLALPADKPFDVVGVGVNVVNELLVVPRFPEPDTKTDALAVVRQGGGVVATALVACARLGLRVKYITIVP
jgi:sulfofructose kinase